MTEHAKPRDCHLPGGPGGPGAAAAEDGWPPFPPMDAMFGPPDGKGGSPPWGIGANGYQDDAFGSLQSPKLPFASPLGDMAHPLGSGMDPYLTTPAWQHPTADDGQRPLQRLSGASGMAAKQLGGLSQIDTWAWEMGSEAGSVPSAWSKATSRHTGHSSVSRVSSAAGDGLIPGLTDGQRLSSVKPSKVSTDGGKIVVSLRKEVPQGYWDTLSVVLVALPDQVVLKPTGIKKGRKLCVQVPANMDPKDYDVRLAFGSKMIHGAIPLSVHRGGGDNDEESEDEDQ